MVREIADRIAGMSPGHPVRVAFDGPAAASPGALADELVDPLRVLGRPAVRTGARWFLRPASVRLEHGRTDPVSFYESWLDGPALRRELLDPLGPGGSGEYVPTLWDPDTDRATRAAYARAEDKQVLLFDGPLLLGQGLPFDLVVHLRLSPAALRRRTEEEDRWTLPAYERYAEEVDPEALADVVVRADDPRRPAVLGLQPGH